jgi:hypothetical protein
MRLQCQKVLLAGLVAILACHDSSGPGITTDFALDNVNGRQLPTFDSPIPENPTILSATLHFNASGTVILTERRQDITQGEFTKTATLDYRMTGAFIEIGCLRGLPTIADCPHYAGTISGDGLSLTDPSQSVTYNYKQFVYAL